MLDGDIREWKQPAIKGQPENSPLANDAARPVNAAAMPQEIKDWRRSERKRLLAMRRTHCAEARAKATSTLLANACKGGAVPRCLIWTRTST